jgi:hypothetical protein
MIEPRYIRMMTRKGFAKLFWEELARMRLVDNKVTHEQVYEMMENDYQQQFGQRRYSSWESFRCNRDR